MRAVYGIVFCWAVFCFSTCNAQENPRDSATIKKMDSSHLPNLIAVYEGVYSGGQPDGEAAFRELSQFGVRTLISVDGAKPDVELAKKHGLKYIHLPHGYDGVPQQRVKELAKALQSIQGPFYIHCHHGKHRSPAAAAAACKSLGWLKPAQATELLSVAGTDPRYRGLFRSVETAQPLSPSDLDAIASDFPSIAKLPPMAELMVEIEEHFHHLQELQKQKWSLKDGKEASIQKALLLYEQFRELQRIDDPRIRVAEFAKMSRLSEEAASIIERELSASTAGHASSTMKLDQAMSVIEANCKACHQLVRN